MVSLKNFGRRPALLAASCLVIDYIMTVAVSISSSTAAIIAAFPTLSPYKVIISIICVGLVTILNLRGISESAKIFGIPTYLFILSMGIMITVGLVSLFSGNMQPIEYSEAVIREANANQVLTGITLLLFLRAFSSGCSALTGVEAVSNAIPSFKKPEQKTAKQVLFLLGGIIVFIFGGTSILATNLKVIPVEGTTVISQMAGAVFGNNFMFYIIQVTTSLILLLAANTAFNGLPNLLHILAKDRYMPHQFSQRGTKLSFSNGILFIFVITSILLLIFQSDTHLLIPFYSVGVFVSFTVSQGGMFVQWLRTKEKGWQYKSLINGIGALVTLVGTVVVFSTKFMDGAWALAIVIPLIMLFMARSHRHYTLFSQAVSAKDYDYKYRPSKSNDKLPCIVLVHTMSKGMLKTFDYAKDVSSDVTPLHISTDSEKTELLKKQWKEKGIDIPLVIIDAPYRDVLAPLEEYVSEREKDLKKGENLTVILTKYTGNSWSDNLYHNQTSYFIQTKLSRHKNIVTVLVPYLYRLKVVKQA